MEIIRKVLKWISSILVTSSLLTWGLAFASTPSYNAGKYAFAMEQCGFYAKSNELFDVFAKGDALKTDQFNDGYHDIGTQNEAGDYGHQSSYNCDEFVKVTNRLFKEPHISSSINILYN